MSKEQKYFSIKKNVLLKHTNLMGNTYFSNYIVWQGELRELCLMSHPNFQKEMEKNKNIHMITHSLSHRFLRESTFGDIVEIRATTKNIKKLSFVMVFRYYNVVTGEQIGEGWQKVSFIDLNSNNYCDVPKFILELAERYKEY